MKNLISLLEGEFRQAAERAFPDLGARGIDLSPEIAISTQSRFGHYQYNNAMKWAKLLGRSPRDIAGEIASRVECRGHPIERLEIAGPGFINITLHRAFLSEGVEALLRSPRLGIDRSETPERIIIDFSSPNVAKEMHVGHLRSTIIGECLARLFEFLGHDVLRLSHVGDWGTAFGMLIAYLKDEAPGVLTGDQPTDLMHLAAWYKAAKRRFDEQPDFKRTSQLEVVALQQGEPQARRAWEIICEVSRRGYEEIYDLLGVHVIERGESYYHPYLAELVEDLEKKGLVRLSDGAKCLFLEGFQNRAGESLPLMLQKSDGGYNYDTTDMAAIQHRIHVEKGDRLIYVTDAGQAMHFQMIFKAAELAGYLVAHPVRLDHVPFGLVLGPDGKRFRTRSGETERLMDLLQAAIARAEELLKERNPEMEEEERRHLAKALGIGAIKYADLSNHRLSDYVFSYDRMLRFEGNTAAFLMYAYVRIAGIKRRVGIDPSLLLDGHSIQLEHPAEVALGLCLLRFHETLDQLANDLLPHRLSDYLYALAENFNAFFRDCRVEGSAEQMSRLLLCEATARVLQQGLHILGVETVERM